MQPTAFTCDRCRTLLPPGASVCPNCGQTFYVPSPPSARKGLPAIAIVGIIGGVGCFPVLILAAILFPVFAKARDRAREMSSMSNLKMIGLASLQYEDDHNEKFPPTDTLEDFKAALNPYIKSQDNQYYTETGTVAVYALNSALSNNNVASVGNTANVILAYETVPHGDNYFAVLYADGHVQLIGHPPSTSSSTANSNAN